MSGQVSQDVRDPSNTYTFAANDNGRLETASLNGSVVGSYLYNAFEQRVRKTAGATTTQFIYDRAGHLLEEANGATGAAIREYIWLDDLPVAMVDDTGASPVLYFIHTDQLGTPQKITDGNASVVWEGLFDPFGNAITITGANWGTGIWGSFDWAPTSPPITTTKLRFPGQYADSETALNQNWNRDYDPTLGRYVESDPIGLSGGTNTYNFGFNNTERYYDSTGLFAGSPSEWEGVLEEAAGAELAGGGPEDPFADAAAAAVIGAALLEGGGAGGPPSGGNGNGCSDRCETALGDANRAYNELVNRSIPQYMFSSRHGEADVGHYDAIQEGQRRLKNALSRARYWCRPHQLPNNFNRMEVLANQQFPIRH